MAETPHREIDLVEFIQSLGRQTHASTAMVLSSRLEQALTWIVEEKMPNLSNRQKTRLFEGYGPLASFSAKIDIAFALGFISDREAQKLHALRKIRNEFAHSDDADLSFEHDSMTELFMKLPKPKGKSFESNIDHFTFVASECAGELQEHLNHAALIKALVSRPSSTSPEKSD